ncbi:MAG: winged helix-turn-helix transcriptional regulator [Patescibacteria group bacterium]
MSTQSNTNKCSAHELQILGDYWTLSIIQVLSASEKRFSEIERELASINPTTLSNRLKKLEEQGLIVRKEETVDKLSVVYALTDKGIGILPILKQIKLFAEKYLSKSS